MHQGFKEQTWRVLTVAIEEKGIEATRQIPASGLVLASHLCVNPQQLSLAQAGPLAGFDEI